MTAKALFTSATDTAFEPFDAGSILYVRRDDDVTAGIWVVTPEEAPDEVAAPFQQNETIHVLEGRVQIDIVDGPKFDLGPGDTAAFFKGTVGKWRVVEPLRQFFVYSN